MPNALEFDATQAIAELSRLSKALAANKLPLTDFATSFTKFNATSGGYEARVSGVTAANQKLTASFKNTAGTIALHTLKLTENAAAMKAAAAASASRKVGAATARSELDKAYPTSGLAPDQAETTKSRILAIQQAIEKGRTSLTAFNSALFAAMHGFTGALTTEEQKILGVLNRMGITQDKATAKARASLAAQRAAALGESTANRVGASLTKRYGPDLAAMDSSQAERVRRQINQIQRLFSKGLDASGYARAMKAVRDGTVTNLSAAEQQARHYLSRIQAEVDSLRAPSGGGLGGLDSLFQGQSALQAGAALILAEGVTRLIGEMRDAVQAAADYSRQISLLRTITQDVNMSFGEWNAGINAVSSSLGRSREEVANAGYELLSNQVTKGADSFRVLQQTGEFAIATNSSMIDSVNMLSSIINSFGYTADDTDKILGKMFTTIDLGRVKASELAESLGRPSIASKTLGLSFDEMNAAIITISQTGLDASQTNTLLTNVIHKLLNPTKELQALYDKLGVSTGEMFVKTYTFAGVLEILKKETGGSTAELAKYFNEIRGEQGINALIERLDTFRSALKASEESVVNYAGALKLMDGDYGVRFEREMTKINVLLGEWKLSALEWTIYLTEGFGGLAKVAELVFYGSMAGGVLVVGTRIAEVIGLIKIAEGATMSWGLAMKMAFPFGLAATFGAEIGIIIGQIMSAEAEFNNFHKQLLTETNELAAQQLATGRKLIDSDVEATKSTIAEQKRAYLAHIAEIITGLGHLAEAQKNAFKDQSESIKNNLQNYLGGLKRHLDATRAEAKKLEDGLKKIKEDRLTSREKNEGEVFGRSRKINEINVGLGGRDQERQIFEQEIHRLQVEAARASRSGTPEGMERAHKLLDQARGTASEMAGITKQLEVTGWDGEVVGSVEVFKFRDADAKILEIERQRVAVNNALEASFKRQLAQKQYQALIEANYTKEVEDRAKAVYDFKAFTDTGTLRHGTPEKTLQAFEQAVANLNATLSRSPERRNARDVLEQYNTTAVQRAQLKSDLEAARGTLGRQLGLYTGKEQVERARSTITQSADPAQLDKAKESLKLAENATARAGAIATSSIGALIHGGELSGFEKFARGWANAQSGAIGPTSSTDSRFSPQVNEALQSSQAALRANDYSKANTEAQRAVDLAKQLGEAELLLPEDAQGRVKSLKEATQEYQAQLRMLAQQAELSRTATGQIQGLTQSIQQTLQDPSVSKYAADLKLLYESSGNFTNTTGPALSKAAQDAITFAAAMKQAAEAMQGMNSGLLEGTKALLKDSGTTTTPLEVTPGHKFLGGLIYRAGGGLVQGSDRNLVMAADGEFMTNSSATSRFLPQLVAMNAGFNPFVSQKGGQSFNFGDMHLNVQGGSDSKGTARELIAGIKREIRRGTMSL